MADHIEDAVDAELNRQPEVDFLLLADRAEVVNNKVYVMGGGWDTIAAAEYPHQLALGLIVGFRIPWSHANIPQSVSIEMRRDDATSDPLLRVEAQLEAGRPPGRNALDTLVPMAFNGQTRLEAPGAYVVTARIGEGRPRRQVITATQIGKRAA